MQRVPDPDTTRGFLVTRIQKMKIDYLKASLKKN